APGDAMALEDGAITAAKIEADAVAEMQSGLATAADLATVDGNVDAVKAVTDDLAAMLEDDAGTPRFTANALEEAPTGGGTAPTAEENAAAVWNATLSEF